MLRRFLRLRLFQLCVRCPRRPAHSPVIFSYHYLVTVKWCCHRSDIVTRSRSHAICEWSIGIRLNVEPAAETLLSLWGEIGPEASVGLWYVAFSRTRHRIYYKTITYCTSDASLRALSSNVNQTTRTCWWVHVTMSRIYPQTEETWQKEFQTGTFFTITCILQLAPVRAYTHTDRSSRLVFGFTRIIHRALAICSGPVKLQAAPCSHSTVSAHN